MPRDGRVSREAGMLGATEYRARVASGFLPSRDIHTSLCFITGAQ
jgi:hypothetical protein